MFRLPGCRSVEEALDLADELAPGHGRVVLYRQPSVPVCGTVEVEVVDDDPTWVVTDLVAEARRLEVAARELRELAERVARGDV